MNFPQTGLARNHSRAEWMLQRLADDGLRMTGPRARVVHEIAGHADVFSAEDIVDKLRPKGIGRATVYRALDVLEERGMLSRMHVGDCHGYTVCDEGHHHHLRCTNCRSVVPVDASVVEAAIQRLAEQLRFHIETHTLEFSGLCETCSGSA